MKKVMIALIALLIFASVILFGREPVTPGPQDFVAHYFFQSWQRTDSRLTPTRTVVNNLWIEFDDDFFAENYLVIFNITMPTTAFSYVVESVQCNGDIRMVWRPEGRFAGDMLTYWTVVIEMSNNFRPRTFNVLLPQRDGEGWRDSNIRVRTYRRNIGRTAANQHESSSRQYYVIRHNLLVDDNRPVRILEDIREFHHMWSVIYTIQNDGSLWSWHNHHASGAVISTWIIDDAQVFLNEPFPWFITGFFDGSVIDTSGILWRWSRTRRHIKPIMEDVRWAQGNLVITNDNGLWSWGDNSYGQVGDGTREYRYAPVRIMDNVREAFTMGTHNMALTYDGSLWAWGSNYAGQLGDGTTEDRESPVMIFQNVLQVSYFSHRATTIITWDGRWSWGNGRMPSHHPTRRPVNSPVANTAGLFSQNGLSWLRDGSYFALTYSGELWAWGNNDYGRLGDGSTDNRDNPVLIMSGVSELFMGRGYAIALTADGAVYTWGRNDRGQLGDGTAENQYSPVRILENVQEVSASNGQNIALTRDGELWLWGSNMHGPPMEPTIYRSEHSTRNNRPFFNIRENPFIN